MERAFCFHSQYSEGFEGFEGFVLNIAPEIAPLHHLHGSFLPQPIVHRFTVHVIAVQRVVWAPWWLFNPSWIFQTWLISCKKWWPAHIAMGSVSSAPSSHHYRHILCASVLFSQFSCWLWQFLSVGNSHILRWLPKLVFVLLVERCLLSFVVFLHTDHMSWSRWKWSTRNENDPEWDN